MNYLYVALKHSLLFRDFNNKTLDTVCAFPVLWFVCLFICSLHGKISKFISIKSTQYKRNWREHIQRMDDNRLPKKKIKLQT